MRSFSYYLLLFSSLLAFSTAKSQESQVLHLNLEQIETLFLQNNLELLAERMNIDIAEAEVIQAKLWDNPELSISDVNLWSSNSQREGESEVIPPVFGDKFLRNTQFSIELSQLIQTANKRGRLVRREKVGKQITEKEFEELLRGLKLELRNSVNEIVYLQQYIVVLKEQRDALDNLITTYAKLVTQGNIAKAELIRLKSALLQVDNDYYETSADLNEQTSTLKVLLALAPTVKLEIADSEIRGMKLPKDLMLDDLLFEAELNRPDVQAAKLQTEYQDKALAYEKSLRVPDITLSAAYDRRGGVWRDFVGFGISVDIPFFDRNQGGIKAAKFSKQQSIYQAQNEVNKLKHEVTNAYNNYTLAYQLYKKSNDEELLNDITNMQKIYSKYLINKSISMVEYLDFMDAYKDNMETILTAKKKLKDQYQELQFTIGTDIK